MIVPTIHSNGTSRERLIEDLCAATQALDLAYKAVRNTAPNGRDYYTRPDEHLGRAIMEHLDRLSRIDAVKLELEQPAEAIANA